MPSGDEHAPASIGMGNAAASGAAWAATADRVCLALASRLRRCYTRQEQSGTQSCLRRERFARACSVLREVPPCMSRRTWPEQQRQYRRRPWRGVNVGAARNVQAGLQGW